MSLWVFDTLDRCNTITPANAVGTIYANGECQTIETSTAIDSPEYALFPGNYRAFCTTEGLIRFHESGCIEPTCSVTTGFEDNGTVCSRDASKISALYSHLAPPEYIVQDVGDTSPEGLYTCLRLMDSGINVTFVVFGDCSDPGCAIYDGGATPPTECNDSPDCGWWFPGFGGAECIDGFCANTWAACFSGRSMVEVEGHGAVPMDTLKVGDHVRVRNGSYSRVHSFGHYQPNAKGEFLQILTAGTRTSGKPLEITADHLLYVHNVMNKREEVVPAGEIKIGDYLVTDGGTAEVVAIHKTQTAGLYSPLTATGEIAVGGVLASNYVSRSWLESRVSGNALHLLQHGAATSHRIFCEWFGCQQETYDEVTGFSPLVAFWYRLEQWQLRLSILPRALFFTALAPLAFCAVCIGQINVAPIVTLLRLIIVMVGVFVWKHQAGNKCKNNKNKKVEQR